MKPLGEKVLSLSDETFRLRTVEALAMQQYSITMILNPESAEMWDSFKNQYFADFGNGSLEFPE